MWAQLEAAVRPRGSFKVADSTALTLPLPTHQVLLSADPATEILARSGLIPSASAAVISGKEGGVRCHLTIARAPAATATATSAATAAASAAAAAATTAVTAQAAATAAPPPVTPLEGGGLKGADAAAAEGRRRPPRAEEEVEVQCRVGEGSEGGGSRRWLRARVTRATAVGGDGGDGDGGGEGGGGGGGGGGEGGGGGGGGQGGGEGGEEGVRCDLEWEMNAEIAEGQMPEALVLAVWRGVNWRYAK